MTDPDRSRTYQRARGKGGFVRSSWTEVTELVAAAQVHTIKQHGPDRIIGFSPIPAMSMVSYWAGTRFLSMIGPTISSFYDWYADLPVASPQVFGDQTDVPESADWWNAGYLIVWGTNLPITRTPDAHFMTEASYGARNEGRRDRQQCQGNARCLHRVHPAPMSATASPSSRQRASAAATVTTSAARRAKAADSG